MNYKKILILFISIIGIYTASVYSISQCPSRDTIAIDKIKSLTLHRDEYTTGMRGKAPILQLQCAGGYCNELPSLVQCKNTGPNDRGEIQWSCKGEVTSGFSLGRTDVSCISCGETSDGIPLVLKGSCGVSVEVLKDSKTSYQNDDYSPPPPRNYRNKYTHHNSQESSLGLGWIFLIIVIIFILLCICGSGSKRTYIENSYPSAPTEEQIYRTSYHSPPKYETYENESNPGFWSGFASGAAVGGLSGYAIGKNSDSNNSSNHSSSNNREEKKSKKTSTGYGGTSFR